MVTSVRTQLKVKCIRLSGPGPRSIESIVGIGGDGGWRMTKTEAIDAIESRRISFYTQVNGRRAEVGVFEQNNRKYLRTYADGYWDNNLEALPNCY